MRLFGRRDFSFLFFVFGSCKGSGEKEGVELLKKLRLRF